MHTASLHIGHLLLPASGIAAAIGLLAALLLSLRTAPLAGVSPDALWNAGLFAVMCAFVVSRLLLVLGDLHSFLRYPVLLLMVPSLTFTGLFVTALATALYLRLHQLPLVRVLDAWAPCATLLWGVLALGQLAEGTDPGLPTHLPWGMRLASNATPQHPVAFYAAVVAFTLTAVLLRDIAGARMAHAPGSAAALALTLTGLAQFFLSFLREPLLPAYTPTPLVEPLQWLALAMLTAGSLLFLTRPHPAEAAHAV